MADRETLKEFLVKLGFDVDSITWQKFHKKVKDARDDALLLSTAFSGVVVGVAHMVNNLAEGMESLYFLSQRAKSTTASLQALGFAASNIGLDPNAVQNLVGNMRMQMRAQPGLAGVLAGFGINPGQDTTKILNQLVGRLSKMPFYVASQYGEMFGIDPATLQRMIQNLPEMLRGEKQFAEMQKEMGVNADQGAKAFHEYENAIRESKNRMYVFAQAMGIALEPSMKAATGVLNHLLKGLAKLVGENKKVINTKIIQFMHGFMTVVERINVKNVVHNVHDFALEVNHLADAIGGWKTVGIAAMTMFLAPFAASTIDIIAHLGRLVYILGTAMPRAIALLSAATKLLFASPWGIALLALAGIAYGGYEGYEFFKGKGGGNAWQGFKNYIPKILNEITRANTAGAGPLGLRNNNPGNLQPGGVEAHYPTMQAGLNAMASLLVSYSKHGLNTIRKIISKYAPASAGNPTGNYIRNVAAALGISPDKVLDLAHDPQTLARLMGPMVNFENGKNPIAPSALLAAARNATGGVVFQQHTEIKVSGATDPQKTADAIGRQQSRVNADLLHNFHVPAY